jgi:predicted ATPase
MNIKAIRLRNFRGFRDATIELKPLTVLLGPNSAGKSAFGHALAAMAHAHSEFRGSVRATLSPRDGKDAEKWPIDLGKHSDVCTEGTTDPVYIELQTREGWLKFGFGGLQSASDLRLSYIRHPLGLRVSSSVEPSLFSRASSPEAASSKPGEVKPLQIDDSAGGLELTRMNELQWQDATKQEMVLGLNGLVLDTVRVLDTVHQKTQTEILLSGSARDDVRSLLEHVTYLRASRKRPSRGYDDATGNANSIGYAGEWTASVLNNNPQRAVEFAHPPNIPNQVDEARKLIDCNWEIRSQTLSEAVGAWLWHLKLATAVETKRVRPDAPIEVRVTLSESCGSRDITEIGYGVSQVLPILVGGLLQSKDGLFIVDLPEAHLHPQPQADLADFFCSLALSGRACLVETHSEMFFHRLRLWAAMNKSLMDNIAVYFFDPHKENGLCSEPRIVGLDFDSELKWPVGFLQEAWETEAQITAARQACEHKA